MLRSIYERLLGTIRTIRRPKPRPRVHTRRLTVESLEGRRLLTTTLLTQNSVSDADFAAPNLTLKDYQIAPPSSPWQFTGIAGVTSNNSGFTHGDPNAPVGSQAGFIKDTGTISQEVTLDAGVYNLSLLAAQRINYQSQPQSVEVEVDGVEVGAFEPNTPIAPITSTNYAPFQTTNFTVTQGNHVIEFLGLSPDTADSTVFIDEVAISPAVDSIADGGFEEPALPLNGYATDASGSAWQFSGTAGIAKNGSDFLTNWTEAQNAPVGTQVAYLQETGSMTQTDFVDAGTYQLTFLAAQRAIFQSSYQEVEIFVDGVAEGIVNPVNILYGTYNSDAFTLTTGPHTFEFVGLDPQGGDNTVFIDQATLSPNAVLDGSFETPQLAGGAYTFDPAGSSWQFSGTSGIAHNGSAYTTNNPDAPDGLQVGLIKNNGSISQTIDLLEGSYVVSCEAAQRATNEDEPIEVLIDGLQVGVIAPVGVGYSLYDTPVFTITTAGTHTLELLGLGPAGGDNTTAIDEVAVLPTNDEIVDGDFLAPALPANAYLVAPSNTTWQFSGSAGIARNDSGIASGNPGAPPGSQMAFLMDASSMTYTTYLDANTYDLSFVAAQRANGQPQTAAQNQEIEVLVDGSQVGLITPFSTTYSSYETSNFTVSAGVHTIEFLGLNSPASGSSTALIDEVALSVAQDQFVDGGFETPGLIVDSGQGTYQDDPQSSAWQFTGDAGISGNDSGFTYVTPNLYHNGYTYNNINAPEGAQVAFIKDGGTVSQTVDMDAGSYSISFLASQRVMYQTQNQQIEVLVDGAIVGTFTPALLPEINGSNITYSYSSHETTNFTVAAGAHTVEFIGLAPSSADSTALIDSVTLITGAAVSDGDFEDPALATDTYVTAPTGTPWQFTGSAGVTANYSGFTQNNPNAPVGVQAAFIKDTGTISQSVYLAGGIYNISFDAAQRDTWQSSFESIEILVDGVEVGTATPAEPPVGATKTSYGLYETTNFTVSAGVHTIEFVGVNPSGGDNTAFIDDVELNL
jgi:hypothetical protein